MTSDWAFDEEHVCLFCDRIFSFSDMRGCACKHCFTEAVEKEFGHEEHINSDSDDTRSDKLAGDV